MNMLELINTAKYFADSKQLSTSVPGTETDTTLDSAFWATMINLSQQYHFTLIKNKMQDYFATKTTISFVSGTQEYDLPGDSVQIRYLEKTDSDPDEVISPISIDSRLRFTDSEDSTDSDDTLEHFAYLWGRVIGIVPNMATATGGVNVLYIRRLPDLSYGIVSSTPTTVQVRLAVTPIFGKSSNEDDHYNGSRIRVAGKISEITDYTGSNRACTVAFTVAPAASTTYDIMCDIPEEHHACISLYAAILANVSDHERAVELAALHTDWKNRMLEGLQRFKTEGTTVVNNDL